MGDCGKKKRLAKTRGRPDWARGKREPHIPKKRNSRKVGGKQKHKRSKTPFKNGRNARGPLAPVQQRKYTPYNGEKAGEQALTISWPEG